MRQTGYPLASVYSFSDQKLQVMKRSLLCLLMVFAAPVSSQQGGGDGISADLTTSLRPRARSSAVISTGQNTGQEVPEVSSQTSVAGFADGDVPLSRLRPRGRPGDLVTQVVSLADLPSGDADFRAALSEMRAGRWDNALRLAGPEGSVARDVIRWHQLRNGLGRSSDVTAFLARSGDWPGLAYLREKSESTMEDAPIGDVLMFYTGHEPQTGIGALTRAKALATMGHGDAAEAGIIMAWRTLALSEREQETFLSRYGAVLAPHHTARLDQMLWKGWKVNATRMLPLVGADWTALAKARMALRAREGNPDPLIAAVPPALSDDPGLAYERFEWRMQKGLTDSATALLLERSTSAKSLGEPEYWASRRRDMARRAMRDGKTTEAYRVAATHFTTEGNDFADLEWLSGYLALRFQKDGPRAAQHFNRFRGAVFTPISLGRAGYWLGRAHEQAGNRAEAQAGYALGAKYQTSFYGLLAAERGGLPFNAALAGYTPAGDWRQADFTKSRVHEAAMLFLGVGEEWLAERFWTHLAETQDEASLHMMGKMLEELGQPHIGVMLGKRAAQAGLEIAAPYYAIHPVAARNQPIPKEMILAIARRESEFDHTVISHAGARGLMQVMPATAQLVARRVGLGYSRNRLTRDWGYNAQLGADYLRGLAEDFDGNVVMMSAGYNAGPGRPRSWMQRNGDPRRGSIDVVDWIEMIPFNETRNYVMRVAESLPVYRARLGKAPHPVPFSKELVGSTLLPLSP